MAIDLQICNEALSEIGARAVITDANEASTEGAAARLYYDTMRKRLLRVHHWSFARRTELLVLAGTLEESTSVYPFLYQYDLPSDYIAMRYVLPTINGALNVALVPCRDYRFLITASKTAGVVSKCLVSNLQDAVGVYTGDITDTTQFDDLFHAAFVSTLAAKFVMPCTGNVQLRSVQQEIAQQAIWTAQAADANEAVPSTDSIADWHAARGVASLGLWGECYAYPAPMNWGS